MEITKEQKEAIEDMNRFANGIDMSCVTARQMQIILNLIEKLQKENEKYKRLAKINLKNVEEFKDNMCNHRCLLKNENKELKARLDELSKNNFPIIY